MAHAIGFVDNTGTEGLAHWQMLLLIKTTAEANGWTTQRYVNPTDGSNRELILKGVGLSGTEEIYIGFRAYHSVSADYYNLTVAGFTGYVAGNAFAAQPGYYERGLCAHNQHIDYWLAVNGQRIMFALRVGVPAVYEMGYAGKIFPYATPGQYPYPLMIAAMLPSATPATRFSDTSAQHAFGGLGTIFSQATFYNYDSGRMRSLDGAWIVFRTHPWTSFENNAPAQIRDSGGYYSLLPAIIMTRAVDQQAGGVNNVVGEFDGIHYVSGFNLLAEYTATVDGKLCVIFGNAWRTGIGDYLALEMD